MRASFLGLFFFVSAWMVSAEPSPRTRAKWALANQVAARQVLDALEALSGGDPKMEGVLVDKLAAFIRKNIDAHRGAEESKKLCLEQLKIECRRFFYSHLEQVVKEARAYSPMEINTHSVLAKMGTNWQTHLESKIEDVVRDKGASIFMRSRQFVVLQQEQELGESFIAPNHAALDQRLLGLNEQTNGYIRVEDFELLLPWLNADCFEGRETLLEEVKGYREEFSRRFLNDVKVQYDRQLEKVYEGTNQLSDQLIYNKNIFAILVHRISEAAGIEEEKKWEKAIFPRYDVFSITSREAQRISRKIELDRFMTFISHHLKTRPPEISTLDLRKNLRRHKNYAQSLVTFFQAYISIAASEIVLAYNAKSVRPDEEGMLHLTHLLEEDGPARKHFMDALRIALEKTLQEVRLEIKTQQWLRWFTPLKQDALPGEVIDRLYLGNLKMLHETYPEIQNAWTKANIMFLPSPAEPLLEETEQEVVRVLGKLVKQGLETLDRQLYLLSELEEERREDLKKEKGGKHRASVMLKEWTIALEAKWQLACRDTPSPYKKLFGVTIEHLNKTIRQLFTTVEGEKMRSVSSVKSEQSKKDISRPVLNVKHAATKRTPDCSLYLANASTSGFARARFKTFFGDGVKQTLFVPVDVVASAQKIHEEFSGAFDALIQQQELKGKEKLMIRMFVFIQSLHIRHHTSLLLREAFERQLHEWAHEAKREAELVWITGF